MTLEVNVQLDWSDGGGPRVDFTKNGVSITDGALTVSDPMLVEWAKRFTLDATTRASSVERYPIDVRYDATFFVSGKRISESPVTHTEFSASKVVGPDGLGIEADLTAQTEARLKDGSLAKLSYGVSVKGTLLPLSSKPPTAIPELPPPLAPWLAIEALLIAAAFAAGRPRTG